MVNALDTHPLPASPSPSARVPTVFDGVAFEALMAASSAREDTGDSSAAREGEDAERDEPRSRDERAPVERGGGQKDGEASDGGGGSGRDDDSAPAVEATYTLAPPSALGATGLPVQASGQPQPPPQAMTWQQMCACVEKLLVGEASRAGPAAMFTLSPDLLSDTTITLARTLQGWNLRIHTHNPDLLDDAGRHEAALQDRFAKRGLGDVVIERLDPR